MEVIITIKDKKRDSRSSRLPMECGGRRSLYSRYNTAINSPRVRTAAVWIRRPRSGPIKYVAREKPVTIRISTKETIRFNERYATGSSITRNASCPFRFGRWSCVNARTNIMVITVPRQISETVCRKRERTVWTGRKTIWVWIVTISTRWRIYGGDMGNGTSLGTLFIFLYADR